MKLLFFFCILSAYATSVVDAFPSLHYEGPVNIEARARSCNSKAYEAVWAAILNEFGVERVGDAIDKCFNLMPCKKCSSQQVKDKSGKCNDCGKNKTPNTDGTACVWKSSGCPEDQIQANGKMCQSCSGKQKPNSTGKKCVDPKSDKDKNNNQGRCPNGKIIDHSVGGQDSSTKNPKCIADDDEKCPSGQIAASRRKGSTFDDTYEPECGKDSNPKFECKDPNTFDYKYFGKGGDRLVQHSCRATQEYEKRKKETYQRRVDQAKAVNERQKKRADEQKKRTRGGWCWVNLAMAGAWNDMVDDLSNISMDEVDGMVALYPDDMPVPSGSGIPPDYVVEYDKLNIVQNQMDSSAFGGAIVQVIPKLFKGASGGAPKIIKEFSTGARKEPSKSAINAAKNSKTVQKILKDDRYLDCLTVAADAAASVAKKSVTFYLPDYRFSIDWDRTEEESSPAPEGKAQGGRSSMTLQYSASEDLTGGNQASWYTYDDSFWHRRRLPYELCQRVADSLDNKMTSVSVSGGCCAFYDDQSCQSDSFLFSVQDRQDGKLRGDDNDVVGSYWCTYNIDCEGRP